MNFNRKYFQFSPDFGREHASGLFRDHFDEPFEGNEMFSEGAPPGRWDATEMPRFHAPGFSHDFIDGSPFNRSVGSIFSNRPRSAFGDIPIKVSHQRSGSGDASDTESRASGSSDGSMGLGRAPKVHHIPIHVETRPQKNDQAPPQTSTPQHAQQQPPIGHKQADVQFRQKEVFPEQQQMPQQHFQQHRQSSPPHQPCDQRFFRSSTPQRREDNPYHFSTLPQFRERTLSDQMSRTEVRPGVRIPVQVERSDSSPVIGEERFAQRKSPERAPESHASTGTFPRAKNNEAPLRWVQGLFKGPRASELPNDQQQPQPPLNRDAGQPQPPTQKVPVSSQEKIEKVLADLVELDQKVEAFKGTDQKAKEYRFLDEMLTRLMLSLDDVITDGNECLRAARKSAVKEVQRVIEKLERIVQANAETFQQKSVQLDQAQQPEHQELQQPVSAALADGAPRIVTQKEPFPPKREKSPSKKRQASPTKSSARSSSSKKDAGANNKQRSASPPKKTSAMGILNEQEAIGKDPAIDTKSGAGGVSITVNGIPLEAPPPTSEPVSAFASSQAPEGLSKATTNEPVTPVGGTGGEKSENTTDTQTGEPATPEPVVLSTADIQLKK
ncbi:hypothetical protein BIW11_14180 [Tropilaelaps mercedesae]|uniref:BAG domain-containing protein n=1 Tax=Tropilaelaps mercedesae TaxID=418985 RepID=A0A1V9WYP8_9ACAR|nr:hypothetical protein BIW11_14180 [Tropilaelaps mercedesae]